MIAVATRLILQGWIRCHARNVRDTIRKMIKGTVALPVYNSPGIAWLCMESLCRQEKPVNGWELIVFEELHLSMLGEKFFRGYERRLYEVGCEKITVLTDLKRIPLSYKWIEIAQAAEGEYFCLCAADNYYAPDMLIEAEKVIKEGDFSVVTKGYFYDFFLNKVVLYEYFQIPLIGLQMTASTKKVREFALEEKNRGVDTWFSSHFGNETNIVNTDSWKHILCTNGLNNISNDRWQLICTETNPFNHTDTKLEEIVPECIAYRIKDLSKSLNGFI